MPRTSLTTTLIDEIADATKAGEWPERAAARFGVLSFEWQPWYDLGVELRDADPSGLDDHDTLCVTLVEQVEQAEAECELTWLANWRTAAAAGRGNSWTAWATLLERRFPDRWGKRSQPEANDAGPPESIEQALARLERDRRSKD